MQTVDLVVAYQSRPWWVSRRYAKQRLEGQWSPCTNWYDGPTAPHAPRIILLDVRNKDPSQMWWYRMTWYKYNKHVQYARDDAVVVTGPTTATTTITTTSTANLPLVIWISEVRQHRLAVYLQSLRHPEGSYKKQAEEGGGVKERRGKRGGNTLHGT